MSAPAPSMYSTDALQIAQRSGLEMGRANLDVFADTLIKLAEHDSKLLAVTSDSRGSGKLKPFGERYPKQIIEVGIAEQNLVGIAAGLASTNKRVFAVSPACFVTARSLEQIKNDICYSNNPVTVVGISAGVSYGALGTTHHSLHDLAVLRAINNIDIIVPADNLETREAVIAATRSSTPIYLRFGKAPVFHLPGADSSFRIGKSRLVRPGHDVAFIATGETVIHAYLAAQSLQSEYGLNCRVISMHTIRPLDIDAILNAAGECKAVVTVEEHMIHGGLGEACAAVLIQAGRSRPFRIIGIPDEYTVTGSQADIFRHYGISMEGLTASALTILKLAECLT